MHKLLCGEGTQITKEHNKINLFLVIKEAKDARKHSTQERKTGIYYSQTYFLSASPTPHICAVLFSACFFSTVDYVFNSSSNRVRNERLMISCRYKWSLRIWVQKYKTGSSLRPRDQQQCYSEILPPTELNQISDPILNKLLVLCFKKFH